MIQRYSPNVSDLVEWENGEYVLYADHEAEVEKLKAQHETEYQTLVNKFIDQGCDKDAIEKKLAVAVEALNKIDDRCDEPCSSWAVEALEQIERAGK